MNDYKDYFQNDFSKALNMGSMYFLFTLGNRTHNGSFTLPETDSDPGTDPIPILVQLGLESESDSGAM